MKTIKINWYEIILTSKEDGSVKNERHRVHAKYCTVNQCHGIEIIEVQWEEIVGPLGVEADWIIGKKEELNAWVYTADCWNIALLGKEYYIVVHAWWRWIYQWILHNAVKKMSSHWEDVVDIHVYVWPQICKKCFKFGPECKKFFPGEFIQQVDWNFTVDLVWCGISQLQFHGILEENIQKNNSCTYENNDQLFSARRGEKERNFMGVSWVGE